MSWLYVLIFSESSKNQFELFNNMNWVDEEKEKIVSKSKLFGDQGKNKFQEWVFMLLEYYYNIKICINVFLRYTEKLKCRKQEYLKLVTNKQEEFINLKEYVLQYF